MGLTSQPWPSYFACLCPAGGLAGRDEDREVLFEADIPTPSQASPSDPWVPDPHENGQRPQDSQETTGEGPAAPDRLAPSVPDGRIRTRQDFQTLFSSGTSARGELVVLLFRNNGLGATRSAFVTSSRIGGAVVRNRCRRLLREAFRRLRPYVDLRGLDVALIARPRCRTVGAQAVIDELSVLYREAGLWRDPLMPGRGSWTA